MTRRWHNGWPVHAWRAWLHVDGDAPDHYYNDAVDAGVVFG